MGHRLAPGVSYCSMHGGYVFLDRKADRYFFLGGSLGAAFGRLTSGAGVPVEDAQARRSLIGQGILVEAPGARIADPISCPSPRESLLDFPGARAMPGSSLGAAMRIERARWSLRILGLDRTLARIERRKSGRVCTARDAMDLGQLVAPFSAPGWFRASDGECLRRSIGLIDALTGAGVAATLVLGVKLRPFAAHCWVQTGTLLLNERHDRVRDFTPILAL